MYFWTRIFYAFLEQSSYRLVSKWVYTPTTSPFSWSVCTAGISTRVDGRPDRRLSMDKHDVEEVKDEAKTVWKWLMSDTSSKIEMPKIIPVAIGILILIGLIAGNA